MSRKRLRVFLARFYNEGEKHEDIGSCRLRQSDF